MADIIIHVCNLWGKSDIYAFGTINAVAAAFPGITTFEDRLLRYALLLLTASLAFSASPTPNPEVELNINLVKEEASGQRALKMYLTSLQGQKASPKDVSMDVEIMAKLPSLGKAGSMKALRSISRLGQITYRALTFQGDGTIKKDVIARYMTAEVEAAANSARIGISEENYKFKYYGLYGTGDWRLHLFELQPKKKKQGMFDGWVWVEARTGLPVREQGEFVKNPSIFLKKVRFLRDYEIHDGVAYPTHIDSVVETRLVGKAEMSIHYSNYSRNAMADQTRVAAWLNADRGRR